MRLKVTLFFLILLTSSQGWTKDGNVFISKIKNAFGINKVKTVRAPKEKHCLFYEKTNKAGEKVFYAKNFKDLKGAKLALSKLPQGSNEEIIKGSCIENSKKNIFECSKDYRPLCGKSKLELASFDNACLLKTDVLKRAGANKKASVIIQEGLCPESFCVYFQDSRNYFYAFNTKSYNEALDILETKPTYSNEEIVKGTCGELSKTLVCDDSKQSICSDVPKINTKFNSFCSFKKAVLKKAGAFSSYDGYYKFTPCPIACSYEDNIYPVGESFLKNDGCNVCTCSKSGKVTCTNQRCKPWQFKYLKSDIKECKKGSLACPDRTKPFKTSLGCGCKQQSYCPEKIYCRTALEKNSYFCSLADNFCPYSKKIWD